jgi:hypothetical protein
MIKRTILVAALCAAGALATPALAGSANNNASDSGATHGAFADVNGNFGFLGALGGTPGYHNAVGQEPGATGYNNSHVVGNPQGSGPETPPPSKD